MLSVKLPSAAVVAVPLPVAHLAWTVAPPNAAPTAAVPVIFVAAGAVVVESPPPPPQAVSTAAARPVKNRCFVFIPVLISVVFVMAGRCVMEHWLMQDLAHGAAYPPRGRDFP
ncbi:hypothetical protein [Cupriavidus taiwanensis]|uniref:hypothetical protein n=1 Tax=Cupriavidus taiwanensis TaxID=164546 RepID=UPI001F11B473|nr:hypothetical protein [Cupriavidus taiwanensis]